MVSRLPKFFQNKLFLNSCYFYKTYEQQRTCKFVINVGNLKKKIIRAGIEKIFKIIWLIRIL